MEISRIHFRNESFLAMVPGRAEPVSLTPVVYETRTTCGVGIVSKQSACWAWGLMCPRDLITAWRATEVLKLLDFVENRTLCEAYYTSLRHPSKEEKRSYVNRTIKKIGRENHNRIMLLSVPEVIIRAILDNQKDPFFKPDLCSITAEVRAGTIEWRQEFSDAGVRHPTQSCVEAGTTVVAAANQQPAKKRLFRWQIPFFKSTAT